MRALIETAPFFQQHFEAAENDSRIVFAWYGHVKASQRTSFLESGEVVLQSQEPRYIDVRVDSESGPPVPQVKAEPAESAPIGEVSISQMCRRTGAGGAGRDVSGSDTVRATELYAARFGERQ